jgi:hypothetical protein
VSAQTVFGQSQADKPKPGADPEGAFTLDYLPDDYPALRKRKAALNLFAAYGTAIRISMDCKLSQSKVNYEKRNGNTLALVIRSIRDSGVLDQKIKDALDSIIDTKAKEAEKATGCQALAGEIDSGVWDLYKGPDLAEHYRILKES